MKGAKVAILIVVVLAGLAALVPRTVRARVGMPVPGLPVGVRVGLTGVDGLAEHLIGLDVLGAEVQDRFVDPVEPGTQPLVVIDPGHGGTNTGAPGVSTDFYEKQLTLELSGQLARELAGRGYRVVMTRERDEYLSLRERVRRANQLGADLFLSVHANATETHAQRGFETFVLTPEALDVDGRALRADDGALRRDQDEATALVLDDIERGTAQATAAELAAAIQARMREARGAVGDRGVRQSSMDVLLGATMPAVLVEVGFIDHAIEGHELRDPAVQARIVAALGEAIVATLPRAE